MPQRLHLVESHQGSLRLHLQVKCEAGLTKAELESLGRTTPGLKCAHAPKKPVVVTKEEFINNSEPKPTVDLEYAREILARLPAGIFDDPPVSPPTVSATPPLVPTTACAPQKKKPSAKRPAAGKRAQRARAPKAAITSKNARTSRTPARATTVVKAPVRKVMKNSYSGQRKRPKVAEPTPAKAAYTVNIVFKGKAEPNKVEDDDEPKGGDDVVVAKATANPRKRRAPVDGPASSGRRKRACIDATPTTPLKSPFTFNVIFRGKPEKLNAGSGDREQVCHGGIQMPKTGNGGEGMEEVEEQVFKKDPKGKWKANKRHPRILRCRK